jgi:hypothetical protein
MARPSTSSCKRTAFGKVLDGCVERGPTLIGDEAADASAFPLSGGLGMMVAVAAWIEFESAAPDMAAVAHLLWPGMMALAKGEPKAQERPWFPIAFLATIRPDG